MDTIQIIFRCEFGARYGLGHLMRSAALAHAFQKYKHVKTFCFSASRSDGFKKLFNSANMAHIQLPRSSVGLSFKPDNHINLSKKSITIFDNYDVNRVQMITYKQNYPNLIAIDDLADRTFNVDIIINQNIGSNQLIYKTTNKPKLFLGVQYALLRKNILNIKRKKESHRIFMSFGGGEVYERIKELIRILLLLDKKLNFDINVDFVISGINNKEQIQNLSIMCKRLRFNFIENQIDLSPYMAKADFAITAAGSTVFELAYLAVPQIALVIDKNQEITGKRINESGVGTCLGDISKIDKYRFNKTFFSFLNDNHMKQNMSSRAHTLIDGKGSKRVADGILNHYGYG